MGKREVIMKSEINPKVLSMAEKIYSDLSNSEFAITQHQHWFGETEDRIIYSRKNEAFSKVEIDKLDMFLDKYINDKVYPEYADLILLIEINNVWITLYVKK
jgi:hypothetical protein